MFIAYYYVKTEGNCDLSRMSDPHGEFGGKNVLIKRPSVDVQGSAPCSQSLAPSSTS
jgi:hypothetical protein